MRSSSVVYCWFAQDKPHPLQLFGSGNPGGLGPLVFLCLRAMALVSPIARFPVCVGLHSSELVLRGGSLKEPEVLSGLRVVDGKPFLYLQQSNRVLCKFLTGRAACFRPLVTTSVVEELRRLRDQAYRETMTALVKASSTQAPKVTEEGAPVDDLDLEAPTGETLVPCDGAFSRARARALRKAARKQVPRTTVVTCERPGAAPWSVTLLLENGRGAPAMWATADNFDRLLELVRGDIAAGTFRRKPHPQASSAEGRRPPRRRADGVKEYFIKGRWVAKTTVIGVDGTKRVRTLKRKPTEEAAGAARAVPPRAAPPLQEESDDLEL